MNLIKTITIFLLFFFSLQSLAKLPIYSPGSASVLDFEMDVNQGEIQIGIVESSTKTLVIDIKMSTFVGFSKIELTQQYHLELQNGKLAITKAFIRSPFIDENTYILPSEYLTGYDMSIDSFLFSEIKNSLLKYEGKANVILKDKRKVESEKLSISEGTQKVEFWISKEIKPLPIAAIKSSGNKKDQNYFIKFNREISNYSSPITQIKALPLSDKFRSFLPKPNTIRKSMVLP